jgi:CBS domain-containing protein
MRCPNCGFENLPGADACENCLSSLTQDDVPQAASGIERSLMKDPVECLHPTRPLTVELSSSLANALQLMRHHRIGCVLITGEGGRLVGILTERDLLRKVALEGLDLEQCAVEEYMSAPAETSKPDHPLGYALHRMIVSDLRYLPLVNDTGRPIGIVSSRDVIAYLTTRFQAHGNH